LGNGTIVRSAVDIPSTQRLVLTGGSIDAPMIAKLLTGTLTWRIRYTAAEAIHSFNF
jgi:hypothetical protein